MEISKQIEKYAARRGIELKVEGAQVWLFTDDNDMEPSACYFVDSEQQDRLKYNFQIDNRLTELPEVVNDNEDLRRLIDYLAGFRTKTR